MSTEISTVQIIWCTVFTLMLSASVFGNVLVIWIILAHPRMRSVTNYFLLNLAIADFLMATLNGAPNFVYMVLRNWFFGSVLCVVNNFVANLTVGLSAFTMVAVSADRYIAIVRPLEPRMTKGMARRVIGVIWISSALIAFPCLIYSEKFDFGGGEDGEGGSWNKSACILRWEDGKDPFDSNIDFAYNLVLLIITYVVPVTAMGVCYSSIIYTLWGHKQIGETAHTLSNSMASKRKIVRMFVCIVCCFAVSWLPYHLYFIYYYYDRSIVYEVWVQHLYLSFYWLAMATTTINPIIYYFMNTRFRSYIQEIILKCLCCGAAKRAKAPSRLRPDFGQSDIGGPGGPALLRHCSQSCSGEDALGSLRHENNSRKPPLSLLRNDFQQTENSFEIPLQALTAADGTSSSLQVIK